MKTIEVFKKYNKKFVESHPKITYPPLFERALKNLYLEFLVKRDDQTDEKVLFSPLYVPISKDIDVELEEFISNNEKFFDSLKENIITSLYFYSAIIEENSYYVCDKNSIIIARFIHKEDERFELKFYSHLEDELISSYNDKIYIGRTFIDLNNFFRKNFGIKDLIISLNEQNMKIQDRAKKKIRYYEEYKEEYLDEVNYLVNETKNDVLERLELIPESSIKEISENKLSEVVSNLNYIQNLLIELKDFNLEFENKLRIGNETKFVKYLTKFNKDLHVDIRYLRKLICLVNSRITKILY